MKDYTSNDYCDFLWIRDLLSLKKGFKNEFRAFLKKNSSTKSFLISKVAIFGTVVEIKQIRDWGTLYYIDDGTGSIACKFKKEIYEELLSIVQTEQVNAVNVSEVTFSSTQSSESLLNCSSEDDSVFNDRSLQAEEEAAMKMNRMRALKSIWWDIEKSFSYMTEDIKIGDTVFVQGKLYDYYKRNQLYMNTIRIIDTAEEIVLINLKLEDGYEPIAKKKAEDGGTVPKINIVENNRKSGIMTFDHIHHLDTQDTPHLRYELGDESLDELQITAKRRKLSSPPPSDGSMTFDTLPDPSGATPIRK